jgi:Tfp pilus assembly protein PilO
MHSEKLKNKIYTNLLLILVIFGIFYLFIYPIYSGKGTIYKPEKSISEYLKEKKDMNEAISIVGDYDRKLAETNSAYVKALNTLPIDDLNKILPDKADPVMIVYELSKIAMSSGSNMMLSSPRFTDDGDSNNSDKQYNTISVSFSLEGTYQNLKNFLKNLETSERIYNVTSLDFSSDQDDTSSSVNKYSVVVETYYLKSN